MNFEFSFNSEKLILLFNIESSFLDLEIKQTDAKSFGLNLKNEFHFTIMGDDTGKEILDSVRGFEKEKIQSEIKKIYLSINWKIRLTEEFYKIEKEYQKPDPDNPSKTFYEKRKSIIQMAEIDGLEEFYRKVNSLTSKNFPIPIPHITLYTTSSRKEKIYRGIGIYSEQEFKEMNPVRI